MASSKIVFYNHSSHFPSSTTTQNCAFRPPSSMMTLIRFIIFSFPLITTIIIKLCFSAINGRRNRKSAVGFFHPYTNDGGGGERVLWCAVKAIQEENPDLDCLVYTGDHDATPQSLLSRALDRFGVTLLSPPKVFLLFLIWVLLLFFFYLILLRVFHI